MNTIAWVYLSGSAVTLVLLIVSFIIDLRKYRRLKAGFPEVLGMMIMLLLSWVAAIALATNLLGIFGKTITFKYKGKDEHQS